MEERNSRYIDERYTLAMGRIRRIGEDDLIPAPFDMYFRETAAFICRLDRVRERLRRRDPADLPAGDLQEENRELYEDILPENYAHSYADPAFAVQCFGEAHGRSLCCLSAALRRMIGYVFDGLTEPALLYMELFLEVYNRFEQVPLPSSRALREILYWFVCDSSEILLSERIRMNAGVTEGAAAEILMKADFRDLNYLYRYGEYITEAEKERARDLNERKEEEIDKTALALVREWKERAFAEQRIVKICYPLGCERIVRRAAEMFKEIDVHPVFCRKDPGGISAAAGLWEGYAGAEANIQYRCDHVEDPAIFLDRRSASRILGAIRHACASLPSPGAAFPPAVSLLEKSLPAPARKEEALKLSEKQRKILEEIDRSVLDQRKP